MPGYLLVDIAEVRDPQLYEQYRLQVSPGLQAAGGRYLARGRPEEVLEGAWQPSRIVLVRFDSVQAARDWWNSPGYRQLKEMRLRSTRTNMILLDGAGAAAEAS
ncbi:MAG TPA: DUF1330 domain-containing protein [Steroidobacteraceae bacterium]|nr:DUF1330 domain-containing protein [Steroidobacteraceae bacterium]